jgi:hypothetical protein
MIAIKWNRIMMSSLCLNMKQSRPAGHLTGKCVMVTPPEA